MKCSLSWLTLGTETYALADDGNNVSVGRAASTARPPDRLIKAISNTRAMTERLTAMRLLAGRAGGNES